MMALFLGLVVLAGAAVAVALSLLIYGRSHAARLPAVVAIACAVAALVTFAVGEVRYHRCIDHVNAICANDTCPAGYHGPYIPDCQKRRAI